MKKKGLIILVTALILGSSSLTKGENGEESGESQNKVDTQISNIQPKKILVESVKVDKEKIDPGDEFILTYTLVNNTNTKLHNTSLKIASIEGKGTLEGFV